MGIEPQDCIQATEAVEVVPTDPPTDPVIRTEDGAYTVGYVRVRAFDMEDWPGVLGVASDPQVVKLIEHGGPGLTAPQRTFALVGPRDGDPFTVEVADRGSWRVCGALRLQRESSGWIMLSFAVEPGVRDRVLPRATWAGLHHKRRLYGDEPVWAPLHPHDTIALRALGLVGFEPDVTQARLHEEYRDGRVPLVSMTHPGPLPVPDFEWKYIVDG